MAGIDPDIWGPHLWDVLHWITFHYSEMNLCLKQVFLNHLPNLIPCNKCKENYLKHLKKDPPRFKSRNDLSRWLVRIHNATNKLLGKKSVRYEDVKRRYIPESSQKRAKQSFLKWNQIVRNYMNNSPVLIQRSYGDFISFVFNNV